MEDLKEKAEAMCYDFQGDFDNPKTKCPNMSWTMAKKCALKEVKRRLVELETDLQKHTDFIPIHNFLISKIRYWSNIEIEIKKLA